MNESAKEKVFVKELPNIIVMSSIIWYTHTQTQKQTRTHTHSSIPAVWGIPRHDPRHHRGSSLLLQASSVDYLTAGSGFSESLSDNLSPSRTTQRKGMQLQTVRRMKTKTHAGSHTQNCDLFSLSCGWDSCWLYCSQKSHSCSVWPLLVTVVF